MSLTAVVFFCRRFVARALCCPGKPHNHGGVPQQATTFSIDPQANSPFYNNFLWLNHDQYLAFTLVVRGTGLGCGGCFCGLWYSYNSGIKVVQYVVGTPTGVQLPGMTLSTITQFTVGEEV